MNKIKFENLIWLAPISYAIHIPEEFFAGFPAWVVEHLHGEFTNNLFGINNAMFMTILIALTFWAHKSRSKISAFLFLSWASGNLFWNFIFHLLTSAIFNTYSPGLVSASLLYYPISIWLVIGAYKSKRLTPLEICGAFAIGLGLMLFVIWAGLYHFHV